MNRQFMYSSVTAAVIFPRFSHQFNNFLVGFYQREVRDGKGTYTVRKTKQEVVNDIYALVSDLYPRSLYGEYNRVIINFHS